MKNRTFLFVLALAIAILLFFLVKSSKSEPKVSYFADSVEVIKGPVGDKAYLIQDKDILNVYKTVNQVCPNGYNIFKDGVVPYPKNISWVVVECL